MNKRKQIIILLCLLLCLLLGENVFSNRMAIALAFGNYEEKAIDISSAFITGKAERKNGNILINGGSSVTLDIDSELYCINVSFNGGKKYYNLSVQKIDEASYVFRSAGKYEIYPSEGNCVLGIDGAGKVSQIKLEFDSDCKGLSISSVTLNKSNGFSFNFVRFGLATLICVLAFFAITKKWYKITLDTKNIYQRWLIGGAAFLCVISAALGSVKAMKFEKYPFIEPVYTYTCYQQQCDAFLKGQLNLDIEFDPDEYEELENPYDYYLRRNNIDDYARLFDRAYYNGKAYSYFGVVPVLLVYLPICAITGYMPGDGTVSLIFTLGATAAIILALIKLIKYFRIKANLILTLTLIPAVCISSMIYVLNVHPSMYYTAVISGILFFALTLYFSFSAVTAGSNIRKRVFLCLAGMSVVFTVASRPNICIFMLVLVPLYIKFFFNKEVSVKAHIFDFISAAIPVIAGAAAIMWYNAARFSSPFDFGSTYQLTLSDMNYSTVALYKFFPALYHYFIQPLAFTPEFPFLDINSVDLGVYRGYEYIYRSVGAINFPIIWGVFPVGTVTKGSKTKRWMYILTILCAVGMAFADFCLAGTHLRYMGDIMFPLALFGGVALLDMVEKSENTQFERFFRRTAFTILIVSILVGSALLFANEADNIKKLAPAVFRFFEKLFI